MTRYAVAVIAGLIGIGWGVSAEQAPQCGQDATVSAAQLARHRSAIGLARQINTAEAAQYQRTRRFAPLAELSNLVVPEGFEVQVSADGESYTFSVKDLQDPCMFAVFSDQKGVIYRASPLQ